MGYFDDNKKVQFKDLKESGVYSADLIDVIEKIEDKNYRVLENMLDMDTRKDKDFMEPLLYAVKNEKGTYAIYQVYHESLQTDTVLATEIISIEPELIEETPLSKDPEFIKNVAPIKPEIVKYMHQDLKNNTTFTSELCELGNQEITRLAATECKMPDTVIENPELAGNKVFMLQAILQEPKSLEYVSEDLKNNYEFMKEACKEEKVIDYVAENVEEFGGNALSATKDALVEMSTDKAIEGFEQQRKEIKEKLSEETSEDLESLAKIDARLERNIDFFNRIRKGEVDSVRAARWMKVVCKGMAPEDLKKVSQLLKLDEAILEKGSTQKEKGDNQIIPEQIENRVDGIATLEGMRIETREIKGVLENTKEGEKTNGDDNTRTT